MKTKDCKSPTCVYSKPKDKCVKPNSYIQFISNCKNKDRTLINCKSDYNKNKEAIKAKACDYYDENKKSKQIKMSCPKKRTPVDDKCPDEFKVLKFNKHNVKCCYKELKKKEKKAKASSTPLKPSSKTSKTSKTSNKSLKVIENKSEDFLNIFSSQKESDSNEKNHSSSPNERKELYKVSSNYELEYKPDVFKDTKNKKELNEKKGKLFKVLYKYQNKQQAKKVL